MQDQMKNRTENRSLGSSYTKHTISFLQDPAVRFILGLINLNQDTPRKSIQIAKPIETNFNHRMDRNRFKSSRDSKSINSNLRMNRNLFKSVSAVENRSKMQITRNGLKFTVVPETMLIASSSIDERYWNELGSEIIDRIARRLRPFDCVGSYPLRPFSCVGKHFWCFSRTVQWNHLLQPVCFNTGKKSKRLSPLAILSMGSEPNSFQYLSSMELDAISIVSGTTVSLSPFRVICILLQFSTADTDLNRFRFIRRFELIDFESLDDLNWFPPWIFIEMNSRSF